MKARMCFLLASLLMSLESTFSRRVRALRDLRARFRGHPMMTRTWIGRRDGEEPDVWCRGGRKQRREQEEIVLFLWGLCQLKEAESWRAEERGINRSSAADDTQGVVRKQTTECLEQKKDLRWLLRGRTKHWIRPQTSRLWSAGSLRVFVLIQSKWWKEIAWEVWWHLWSEASEDTLGSQPSQVMRCRKMGPPMLH